MAEPWPPPPSAESTAGEEERERDGRRRQGGVARAGEATPAPPTADPPQLDVFLAAVEARRPIPVLDGAGSSASSIRRKARRRPEVSLLLPDKIRRRPSPCAPAAREEGDGGGRCVGVLAPAMAR
jgi:hypothetical protein